MCDSIKFINFPTSAHQKVGLIFKRVIYDKLKFTDPFLGLNRSLAYILLRDVFSRDSILVNKGSA